MTTSRILSTIREGARAGELAAYRRRHPRPEPARPGVADERITSVIDAAGLRGRGGAGFPTGRKLGTVGGARAVPVVVVNVTEGEPTSYKDRLLAVRGPHLLLDGAARAAAAVGADVIYLCVDRTDHAAIDSLRSAVAEREHVEAGGTPVHVVGTPPRYVAGEETALVQLLNGGEAKPTVTPPRPFEKGVGGRPTLINNAETLCHLALIVEQGPSWFREHGTDDEPGTCLVTISGGVARSGVLEIAVGTPMREVIDRAGGLTDRLEAVLVGGYFGAWLPATALDTVALSNASLQPHGAALGCGALFVLPASACGVFESARVLDWFANESAGQCGPCVHGLAAIAGGMHDLTLPGRSTPRPLERWADEVERRGACALPDGAARFLRSSLRVFADHIEEHRWGAPCPATHHRGLLPIPARAEVPEWR
jgi:NADH:ubiquinone oxidoreductase subunit F (NADH-binding)